MHYYILGKIAENNDENPTLCMDHYIKAAQFLDSYGAEFPENILYTAPQYYSIEVLEVNISYFKYVNFRKYFQINVFLYFKFCKFLSYIEVVINLCFQIIILLFNFFKSIIVIDQHFFLFLNTTLYDL